MYKLAPRELVALTHWEVIIGSNPLSGRASTISSMNAERGMTRVQMRSCPICDNATSEMLFSLFPTVAFPSS